MQKVKFYVDYSFEGGEGFYGESLSGRYWFFVEVSDDEFEELYECWDSNDCRLDNWTTDWTGHDALYKKINDPAWSALNQLVKENEPGFPLPLVDAWWELSAEIDKMFWDRDEDN